MLFPPFSSGLWHCTWPLSCHCTHAYTCTQACSFTQFGVQHSYTHIQAQTQFICKHSHICALSHMHSTHSNTHVHTQNCLQLSLPSGTLSPREARHCSCFSSSSIAADVMPPIQVDSEISDCLTAVFLVQGMCLVFTLPLNPFSSSA